MAEVESTETGPELKKEADFNRATLHDAAHMFVARLLGIRIQKVEVNSGQGGAIQCGWYKDRIFRKKDLATVAMAGLAAESVYWGVSAPSDAEADMNFYDEQAMEKAEVLVSAHLEEIKRLAAYLGKQSGGVDLKEVFSRGLLPDKPLSRQKRVELGV